MLQNLITKHNLVSVYEEAKRKLADGIRLNPLERQLILAQMEYEKNSLDIDDPKRIDIERTLYQGREIDILRLMCPKHTASKLN